MSKYVFPYDPKSTIQAGITLRAWLAGMAMQGFLSDDLDQPIRPTDPYFARLAEQSVKMADALLKELAK